MKNCAKIGQRVSAAPLWELPECQFHGAA